MSSANHQFGNGGGGGPRRRGDSKPPRRRRAPLWRILLGVLRWGLCAAAVWFLYHSVSWHDHVRLNDAAGTFVRLVHVSSDARQFTVVRDGSEQTVGRDGVKFLDGDIPDVHYGISGVVRDLDRGLAALAILIFLPVPLLSAVRLIWMLRIQDVRLSFWNAVKYTYAGNFFNFALPGTTGGDLIKAYYLAGHTHRKTEAVTTVFLDRVIGLIGLVLLAGAMILISWDPEKFGSLATGLGAIVGGLIVGSLFVFSRRLRHAIGLPKLAEKLPAGEHLLRIGRAMTAMRARKGLVLAALGNTVVLQFIVMVSAYIASLALHMQGEFSRYLIYVPIGFLIAAVPIAPPQAVGVMEWFYVQFFTVNGLNSVSQAFALALAVRLVQLIWALPGLLVPLFGAHVPTKGELKELESSEATSENGQRTAMAAGVK